MTFPGLLRTFPALNDLLQPSVVTEWFGKTYSEPTPAQSVAWPKIERGKNVLIVSPTGTGKTLAAFLSVLNQLAILHSTSELQETTYAVYVSPLRAPSYDLEKNLAGPLREIFGAEPPIRVGLRTGDTPQSERQKQIAHPPHILLTTPESLSLLLTQPNWLPHLERTRWMIVDEIHSLAESKRGADLSLSMERLENLVQTAATRRHVDTTYFFKNRVGMVQRIGLSATVAPLGEVAQFLVGTDRACEILDVSTSKKFDLRVYSPLGKHPYPPSGYTGIRLVEESAKLVAENRTTLIFTNTRSGAEAATFWLREQLPDLASTIECHHASLDRNVRQEVEERLKRGDLRAVVCSTSLDLGIDIGSIDLVVMLSTPRGVSRALQRTCRAGHNISVVSRGLLMATNMNDLVECCATALLARTGQLDPVRLPDAPLDVLAQHLASMGCTQRWNRQAAFKLILGASSYRNLTLDQFDDVLDYLAGGGIALRQQYSDLFSKVQLYDDNTFETREGRVRRDLMENIGVIPNEGVVMVRLKGRTLGMIEEIFVRQLQIGDVFILSGRPVRLERVTGMECFVSRADGEVPTVPRWNANKMPLSNKVAEEIIGFRGEMRERLADPNHDADELVDWINKRLDCGAVSAQAILRMHAAQAKLSEIPTADFLLVEELVETGPAVAEAGVMLKTAPRGRKQARSLPPLRHYFFHTLIGRTANDALSRVVALRWSRMRGGNAVATPDDYGFVLTVTPDQMFSATEIPTLLAPANLEEDLRESLSHSNLLKYHFRNAAQTGLLVYRNFGQQKAVRKLQFSSEVIFNVLQQHEPDHVLMREAWRDAIHTYLDIDGALRFVTAAIGKPMRLRTIHHVPPLSFAMFATKIKEALTVEDPRETTERLFHLWWQKIEP